MRVTESVCMDTIPSFAILDLEKLMLDIHSGSFLTGPFSFSLLLRCETRGFSASCKPFGVVRLHG